jgi:hypothetical protein
MLQATPVAGQIDYRNLDHGRPVAVEDAYVIEHYAFEFSLPYALERAGGSTAHAISPELSWGVLNNAQLGVELPLVNTTARGTRRTDLAGVHVAGLYTLFTQSPTLPGLALRADLTLPAGRFGGDAARGALSLLATHAIGASRVHLNAGIGAGDAAGPGAVDPLPRWQAGAAFDHTFIRRSLLLIAAIDVRSLASDGSTEWTAGAGMRWQWAPTLVLDAGIHRRLGADGPDLGLTIGVSHTFAIAALMPAGRMASGGPR